ncbi:MAG: hypothetical protein ACRD63_01900 [Pyrinomonadaceae bacterium]
MIGNTSDSRSLGSFQMSSNDPWGTSGGNDPKGYQQPPPYAPPPYNPPPQGPIGPIGGPPPSEPLHPAIPAVISLFIPGIGLLFVPGKQTLAIGICLGWIAYYGVAFILSFVFVGFCLFLVAPLIHIGAGIYTYDEAAKASGGRFPPLLFKN